MNENIFDYIIAGAGRLGAVGEGPQPQLGIAPAEGMRSVP